MQHKPWFKVWQDRILSDPCYQNLSAIGGGILLELWLQNARNMGRQLRLNALKVTRKLSLKRTRLHQGLNELQDNEWIKWHLDNSSKKEIICVEVSGYEESQESSEESKKRKTRKNKARTVRDLSAPPEVEAEEEGEKDKDNISLQSSSNTQKTAPKSANSFHSEKKDGLSIPSPPTKTDGPEALQPQGSPSPRTVTGTHRRKPPREPPPRSS